jgi:lipopolysaccharide transport system permease protein
MSTRQTKKVIIYEPNHIMKAGIDVWPQMFHELIACRELIWRLAIRDISARYKQSILGILWAFLAPLALMIVFIWIKGKHIIPIRETDMPYAAFVFLGQMIWLLFSHGVTTSANSLVAAGPMLKKIYFPREVLVLSSLAQTVFEFVLRIPLLGLIFIWIGFVPKWTIVFLPVALLPLLFMIVGMGFFLSLFNAIVRDTTSVLGIVMTLGMFATPVVYPPPSTWPLSFWINYVNPISAVITACRDLATAGYMTEAQTYFSSALFGLLVFLVGWRIFHVIEHKVAERV